jgi:Protein of unknown function (DUF1552)
MTVQKGVSRRTVVKGLGTAIALPWLESLTALAAKAAPAQPAAAAAQPIRAAFLYVPNGMHMPDWTPTKTGTDFELPWTLEPLKEFKDDINVLTGLTLDKARANGDGAGDHARANAAFLTGRQARKTNGSDIRAGISADQHIAGALGDQTKFPSLEIGIEPGLQAGNCDSGYSCAYQANFSWRGERTPNKKEVDPRLVFERLFGNGNAKEMDASRAKRDLFNKSVLDFVAEDARQLNKQLGATDQRKMDEYFTAVREIEQRIERAKRIHASKPSIQPNIPAPSGIPADMREHIRIMADLMVLSLQGDLTRVVTFPFANDGSNRKYDLIGVRDGHHDLSHHEGKKEKHDKIRQINRFHIEQLAYLLGKLKSVKEGEKTLLGQIMIIYGSGIGDGNRHNHDDLPILLCGHGGGKVQTGRHLTVPRETPLMNLYLAMFERMGAPAKSFGDSTGVLAL